MKRKIALAVSLALIILSLPFSGCDSDIPPLGSGMVKNKLFKDRLIASYTFDDGGEAFDPLTGARNKKYDIKLSSEERTEGKNGDGIESGKTSFSLPVFGDDVGRLGGFSVSYFCYASSETEKNQGYSGVDGVFISSEFADITYGGLSFNKTTYTPEDCTSIGRGAYCEEDYAAARYEKTSSQLASVKNNDYVSLSANILDSASSSLYDEIADEWSYITVVIEYNCLSFYRNGALTYQYDSSVVGDYLEYFIQDVKDLDGGDDGKINCFVESCGIIDDVIIGRGLTKEEVLMLYNDQTGAERDIDTVFLRSALTSDEAAIIDADERVKELLLDERRENVETMRNRLLERVKDKGVDYIGQSKNIAENGFVTWSDEYSPTYTKEGTFDFDIKYYQFSAKNSVTNCTNVFIYQNGVELCALGMNGKSWGDTTVNCEFAPDENTFLEDIDGASVETIVKFDGDKLTVKYRITPVDAKKRYTVKEDVTLSDGSEYTAEAEMKVSSRVIVTYYIELSSYENITLKLGTEAAFDVITSVYGGNKIKK